MKNMEDNVRNEYLTEIRRITNLSKTFIGTMYTDILKKLFKENDVKYIEVDDECSCQRLIESNSIEFDEDMYIKGFQYVAVSETEDEIYIHYQTTKPFNTAIADDEIGMSLYERYRSEDSIPLHDIAIYLINRISGAIRK